MARLGFVFALLGLLGGCSNPCQQICLNMADYASECGLEVTSDDLKTCQDGFADASDEDIAQCRDWNDPEQLREWWTCEDVEDNFQGGL